MIPDSVEEIEVQAFYKCVSLTSLYIPSSVWNIGAGAFSGCPELVLIVEEDSDAEAYAIDNRIRYELK